MSKIDCKLIYTFLIFCFFQGGIIAQVNFSSSNLPIMIVETEGNVEIPDEPKVTARMRLIDNPGNDRNNISDPGNAYDGLIGIEIRGSSSAALFPKKGFGFETRLADESNNNVSLLGMPEENDWVLHGPYSDKSLLRNAIAYITAADIMDYAPRVEFIELVLNGDYHGVYLLTEKIKRDANRVNISKLNPIDIEGDQLTGGYIIKIDKFTGNSTGWNSGFNYIGDERSHDFIFHDPKFEELEQEQITYIQRYLYNFELMMSSANYTNLQSGYPKWIDEDSFIETFLISEMTKNIDAYRLSSYLYKDRDSKDPKLKSGPVWDFNLAFGNANYCEAPSPEGWVIEFNSICPDDNWKVPFFWEKLFADPAFKAKIKARWIELRSGIFANDQLLRRIDSYSTLLNEAQERNFERWPVLGEWVWPNANYDDTYAEEVSYLKDWFRDRLSWMDGEINSFDSVSSVSSQSKGSSHFVYPNPSSESINISFTESITSPLVLAIYDPVGKLHYQEKFDKQSGDRLIENIQVGTLTQGVYFYVLSTEHGASYRGMFVKQ